MCKDREGKTMITGIGTYKYDKFIDEIKIKTPDGMEMKQIIS